MQEMDSLIETANTFPMKQAKATEYILCVNAQMLSNVLKHNSAQGPNVQDEVAAVDSGKEISSA
ncbi:hypothetical protein ABIE26_002917 [Pedobacter africanus]|uniref:Uncharacterized protein n=1 Tax=Pedobacter africanus TaxID=151894 RepID=A0ACC6KWZ4_9SPHI|nr:hypothetical protein [Pedobacter africanus]